METCTSFEYFKRFRHFNVYDDYYCYPPPTTRLMPAKVKYFMPLSFLNLLKFGARALRPVFGYRVFFFRVPKIS